MRSKIFSFISLLLCAIVFDTCLVIYLVETKEYSDGVAIIEEVNESAVIRDIEIFIGDLETGEEVINFADYYIDFDYLLSVNSDTIGWLMFENPTEISYPIVESYTNTDYLKKAFDGTYNSTGTLFIDMNNDDDFSDRNTIIFGHNMRNLTMFGNLDVYYSYDYYVENPYFYLYTPDGYMHTYEIYVTAEINAEAIYYQKVFVSDTQFTDFLDVLEGVARYETDIVSEVDETSKLITLSTCASDNSRRFIVVGVEVASVKQDF